MASQAFTRTPNSPESGASDLYNNNNGTNQEGFDFEEYLNQHEFLQYNKIADALDQNMIGLTDILDCDETELHEMLKEYNVSIIQRKRFIEAIANLPNSKIFKINNNNDVNHDKNNDKININDQNDEKTNNIAIESQISNTDSGVTSAVAVEEEQEGWIEPFKYKLIDCKIEPEKKRLIGERLFPKIQTIEPRLAGKITGMLLEMKNSDLVKLLINSEMFHSKINEALGVLADSQRSMENSTNNNKNENNNNDNKNANKSNDSTDESGANEGKTESTDNTDNTDSNNSELESIFGEIKRENSKISKTNEVKASLYIGDLAKDTTEITLFELFNAVGPVASIRVVRDRLTRQSLGYAYVNFHSSKDAERAHDVMNFVKIKGKECRIMYVDHNKSEPDWKACIYLKGLAKSIDNKTLCDTFSVFGDIVTCKVTSLGSLDSNSESNSGYVVFCGQSAAKRAVDGVNGMTISNSVVEACLLSTKWDPNMSKKKSNSKSNYSSNYSNNNNMYGGYRSYRNNRNPNTRYNKYFQ